MGRAFVPLDAFQESEGELYRNPPWEDEGWMRELEDPILSPPPTSEEGPGDAFPEGPGITTKRFRELEPVDLRSLSTMPPVRDQEETRACASFALAGLIEHAALNNDLRSFEVATGWMHHCLGKRDLKDSVPIDKLRTRVTGANIPILSPEHPDWRDTTCDRSTEFLFPDLEVNPEATAIIEALSSGRPIATGMIVTNNFEEWSEKTRPYKPTRGAAPSAHAILVVGYSAKGWICRNSYGPGWGDDGYFYVNYGQGKLLTGRFDAYVCPPGFSAGTSSATSFA